MPRRGQNDATTVNKRPRERESEHLQVLTLGEQDDVVPISDEIESFLAPLELDDFLGDHYTQKRALVVKVHPKHREERLAVLRNLLLDFHPMKMLKASPSEGISAWMTTRGDDDEPLLRSVKVPDAESAKTCYDAGHALYFRAPELAESTLLPAYAKQLGFNFGARFRDGATRGEIETFASHPGHVTGWHWDFQENFTVQLRGRKKWYLHKGPSQSPFRACAAHFSDPGTARVLHAQHQFHRLGTSAVPPGIPDDIEENCEAVVLQPGDVLYHPAGIWHKVETLPCDQASLSINMSFFPLTWADLLTETVQHLLLKDASMRAPMRIPFPIEEQHLVSPKHRPFDLTDLSTRLKTLTSLVETLVPSHVLPPCLSSSIATSPDFLQFSKKGQLEVTHDGMDALAKMKRVIGSRLSDGVTKVAFNPLAVLGSEAVAGIAPQIKRHLSPEEVTLQEEETLMADDSDEEGEEEGGGAAATTDRKPYDAPPTYQRFDYHSNWAHDEVNLGGAPAVHVPILVHPAFAQAFSEGCAFVQKTRQRSIASVIQAFGGSSDVVLLFCWIGCLAFVE